MMNSSVYCNKKFYYLKIDCEKRLLFNCNKAYPEIINSSWLENFPGRLFNTDNMILERQMMLSGQRNKGCGYQCYANEDKGLPSSRTKIFDNTFLYDSPYCDVETLDIAFTSDCRATCIYCGEQWSSAWREDAKKHGPHDMKKNMANSWKQLLAKTSQKDKKETNFFHLLIKEIQQMKKLKKIIITGGEPLLYNHLEEFFQFLTPDQKESTTVIIYTGLVVSEPRLQKIIKKIKNLKNVQMVLSMETVGKMAEFIRYGCDWKQWQKNFNILLASKINISFLSTITNLSAIGMWEFYKTYSNDFKIDYSAATYPKCMRKNVLDVDSKKIIEDQWNTVDNNLRKFLIEGLHQEPLEEDRKDMAKYLQSFVSSRYNLSLDIFPKSLISWLDLK